jgi:hypothetical protein
MAKCNAKPCLILRDVVTAGINALNEFNMFHIKTHIPASCKQKVVKNESKMSQKKPIKPHKT